MPSFGTMDRDQKREAKRRIRNLLQSVLGHLFTEKCIIEEANGNRSYGIPSLLAHRLAPLISKELKDIFPGYIIYNEFSLENF
jgi:hypothetical protein